MTKPVDVRNIVKTYMKVNESVLLQRRLEHQLEHQCKWLQRLQTRSWE